MSEVTSPLMGIKDKIMRFHHHLGSGGGKDCTNHHDSRVDIVREND